LRESIEQANARPAGLDVTVRIYTTTTSTTDDHGRFKIM
jgi:hypothetical protein